MLEWLLSITNIQIDTASELFENACSVGNLDNYQHWLIDADSGSSEQITSTETVQFFF